MGKKLTQSVARMIYPKVGNHGISLFDADGRGRSVNENMCRILVNLRIPVVPYQVTYVLNKKGPFKVSTASSIGLITDDSSKDKIAVCFLPPHFRRRRVRREVRLG